MREIVLDLSTIKNILIIILIGLLSFSLAGLWVGENGANRQNISSDNVYGWSEIFHGYEAYLDKELSYSEIQGTSMEPTFGPGDKVIWVSVDDIAKLEKGDIIIFDHPTRPHLENVVHRIIGVGSGVNEGTFEAKGDNAQDVARVAKQHIKGLVIGVIYSEN